MHEIKGSISRVMSIFHFVLYSSIPCHTNIYHVIPTYNVSYIVCTVCSKVWIWMCKYIQVDTDMCDVWKGINSNILVCNNMSNFNQGIDYYMEVWISSYYESKKCPTLTKYFDQTTCWGLIFVQISMYHVHKSICIYVHDRTINRLLSTPQHVPTHTFSYSYTDIHCHTVKPLL